MRRGAAAVTPPTLEDQLVHRDRAVIAIPDITAHFPLIAKSLSVQCGFLWRLEFGLMVGAGDGERGEFGSIR